MGTGSIVAGGAVTFGGSAFNTARADRGISVQITGDDASYLVLTPTSAYAEYDDADTLRLAFDGSIDAQRASGLSRDANYVFTDVFAIRNEGRETIAVTLSELLNEVTWDTNFPRAYYTYERLGTTSDRSGDGEFTGDVSGDGALLDPGDDLLVHFEFVGREADDRLTDTGTPETVSVYAESVSTDS